MSSTPAGWYPDSTGRHQYRYWDGTRWTDDVANNGVASRDPVSETTIADHKSTAQATSGGPSTAVAAETHATNPIIDGDPNTSRLDEILDACMSGHIQESVAELFHLTQARPASVAPDRSIWSKIAAYITDAQSLGHQLTAVKMSQFSIFWHADAFQQSDDTTQIYLGRARADQLRAIRLGALSCCRDLDPATVVIPTSAGGDTAAELVLCETIELGILP